MKLRKKIGLTLLGLSVMTIGGIGLLWGNSCIQGKGFQSENTIEYDNAAKETVIQPVETISDGIIQSGETVVNNIENTYHEELLDLEDYSEAPADNGYPYYVKVNRLQNVVTIYALDEKGYYTEPIKAMVCSVGKNDGTPTGTYQTSDKHTWCSLVGGVYGQYAYRIDGQIMFHSVPYYSMNKGELETEEYNKLGEAASLGCIRLSVSDAKWIYDNCPSGTLVTIYDSEYPGPLGKPVAETLDVEDERSGWDPTDPDIKNPWNNGRPRILGGGDRTIERGCTYQLTCGVLALDGKGNNITDAIETDGYVDAMTVGEYPITYQVQDEKGRVDTVTGIIRVEDTIPPELIIDNKSITLNHAEASESNCALTISQYISAVDAGEELNADCIDMDLSSLEGKTEGSFSITVIAVDTAGNQSEPESITVHLDREPPFIQEPEQKEFTAASDADLEKQLLDAIRVEDNFSGVKQVRVSWVKEVTSDTYMVLVTAKDEYGNVSSKFFGDFIISYESGE